jgi:hypothetical protein
MKGRRVCVSFRDVCVWTSFLEYVRFKYGKTRGMVGKELENMLKVFLTQPTAFEGMEQEYNCLVRFQDLKYKALELEKDSLKLSNNGSSQDSFRWEVGLSQTRFINRSEELKMLEKELVDLNLKIRKIEKLIDWLMEYNIV